MKKIKLLFYTELWANAGIESVIMSLFRNFDLERISVDIMASQNISDFHDEEIRTLGGKKIITLQEEYTSPAKRMMANQAAFKSALKNGHYDIVHLHMCNAASMVYGKIAKKLGVKVVVYHSHNTNLSTNHRLLKTIVHNLCKIKYEKYGDILFSCSDLASKWMFSKKAIEQNKVILVRNAIDLDKFEFNQLKRDEYRKQLHVDNDFVLGHIGRFAIAKNHPFIIQVFFELLKMHPNSKLLLIGEGDDEADIRWQVHELELDKNVIFYGVTKEIPQMLWAMDAFVLPSFFEGNPVVGIEAQAASTPCVFADTITQMCKLTDIVSYLSLEDLPQIWAKKILEIGSKSRKETKAQMVAAGYDIHTVARTVQIEYEKKCAEKGLLI